MKMIKNSIITVILFVFLANLNTINSKAADIEVEPVELIEAEQNSFQSKTKEVELTKDYEKCSFVITFENKGNYSVYVNSPDYKQYEAFSIDDNTMCCEITNCQAGIWTIIAEAEQNNPIGKMNISVQANKNSTTDNSDSIRVGKDIVGLKIFFKNRDIHIVWTDDTCGAVSIKLLNINTNEVLDESRVSGKEYIFSIAEEIDKVKVEIVPMASSNIEGATLYYTYNVGIEPDAEVYFPEIDIVNDNCVSIPIKLNDSYGVQVEVNKEPVLIKGVMPAGEYTFEVPLLADVNVMDYYFVDADGNMKSTSHTYNMDTTPPELVMKSEYSGITTEEEKITITGNVKDYDTFTLNGYDVENVSIDGYFSMDIDLHEGVNVLVLSAKDKAGNETKYEMDITRVIPVEEEKSLTINDILFIIGIVLLGVAFIIKKFVFDRKRKNVKVVGGDISNSTNEESEKQTTLLDKIKGLSERNNKKEPNEKISLLQWIKENKIQTCMILFLLVVFIIIKFIIGINRVSSGSMEPTYMTGDFTIGYKLQYLTKDVERGDIIGFHFVDSDGEKYKVIKRVIGLPGETVSFKDGYVYINGVKLDESEYIDENMETNCIATFTVPEDSYFVLGDNRENSYDSRYWGNPYVTKKDIFEKEVLLIPVSYMKK